jgi:hypothetical protein
MEQLHDPMPPDAGMKKRNGFASTRRPHRASGRTLRVAIFSAADFFYLDFFGIFRPSVGKASESKETKNATAMVLTPPPRGNLFSINKPGIVALTTLQLNGLRSTLTMIPSVSVKLLVSPLLVGRSGRQVIPPPRHHYTPTQSSSESPTSSRAEAS